MNQLKSVCVYCGSNTGRTPDYARKAAELGHFLADHGIRLVYGGSNCGTMGILAESCLKHGGTVLGIITEQLHRKVGNPALTEYRIVADMPTRKRMFLEESDALIALPGGLGTAEELMEAMSWQSLGLNRKPVALLNVNHFFDPQLTWLDRMLSDGFLRKEQRELLIESADIEQLFAGLAQFEYRAVNKWNCK